MNNRTLLNSIVDIKHNSEMYQKLDTITNTKELFIEFSKIILLDTIYTILKKEIDTNPALSIKIVHDKLEKFTTEEIMLKDLGLCDGVITLIDKELGKLHPLLCILGTDTYSKFICYIERYYTEDFAKGYNGFQILINSKQNG